MCVYTGMLIHHTVSLSLPLCSLTDRMNASNITFYIFNKLYFPVTNPCAVLVQHIYSCSLNSWKESVRFNVQYKRGAGMKTR